jgi:hypothetical protein
MAMGAEATEATEEEEIAAITVTRIVTIIAMPPTRRRLPRLSGSNLLRLMSNRFDMRMGSLFSNE